MHLLYVKNLLKHHKILEETYFENHYKMTDNESMFSLEFIIVYSNMTLYEARPTMALKKCW